MRTISAAFGVATAALLFLGPGLLGRLWRPSVA